MKRQKAFITLLILSMLAFPACGAAPEVSGSTITEPSPESFGTELPEQGDSQSEPVPEMPVPAEPAVQAADRAEPETAQSIIDSAEETQAEPKEPSEEETEMIMKLKIGDTAVETVWEENESVEALKALCADEPLVVEMSMYGGFEQVGSIGTGLPRNDVQTITEAGDIVLYSGDQIVVFYGSNSWAYTRLGHITDRSPEEMTALLGNGDVTITIGMEAAK